MAFVRPWNDRSKTTEQVEEWEARHPGAGLDNIAASNLAEASRRLKGNMNQGHSIHEGLAGARQPCPEHWATRVDQSVHHAPREHVGGGMAWCLGDPEISSRSHSSRGDTSLPARA